VEKKLTAMNLKKDSFALLAVAKFSSNREQS
jgi:hypothetical protein